MKYKSYFVFLVLFLCLFSGAQYVLADVSGTTIDYFSISLSSDQNTLTVEGDGKKGMFDVTTCPSQDKLCVADVTVAFIIAGISGGSDFQYFPSGGTTGWTFDGTYNTASLPNGTYQVYFLVYAGVYAESPELGYGTVQSGPQSFTINNRATPSCAINSFTCSASTLAWNTSNCTSRNIDNGIGAVGSTGSTIGSGGVTYTLSANDGINYRTSVASCPSAPIVTGTISASPNPCTLASAGGVCTSNITWDTDNATAAQVWTTSLFASSLSGSQSAPWIGAAGSTFTLYDYSSGSRGGELDSVTVTGLYTPLSPITVSLTANPTSMTLPTNSTQLTWTTTGSPTSCTASGSWSGAKSVSGSSENRTGLTAGTYTYTITCSKAGTPNAVSSVSVTVNPTPPVPVPDLKLTDPPGYYPTPTDGPAILPPNRGYTLSWGAVAGAVSCTLTNRHLTSAPASISGSSYTDYADFLEETHTLTCLNAIGQSGSDTLVVYVPPPPLTFTSTCNAPGTQATLNWTLAPGYIGGFIRGDFSYDVVGFTKTVDVVPGTTYSGTVLYTMAPNGSWSSTWATLPPFKCSPVPAPDLKITHPTSSPTPTDGPVDIPPNQGYTLSWAAVANAVSCALTNRHITSAPALISGSTFTDYADFPTETHTMACLNATGGSGSDTLIVNVPPPPLTFAATCLPSGTQATLNWTLEPGYTGGFVRGDFYVDVISGLTTTVNVIPGTTYSNTVLFTRALNGAWSATTVTAAPFRCDPTVGYTVTASPTSLNPGQTVTATWTAPASHYTDDWIGVYKKGTTEAAYLPGWQPVPAGTSGSLSFTAPATPDTYQFIYYKHNIYDWAATSNDFTVNPAATVYYNLFVVKAGQGMVTLNPVGVACTPPNPICWNYEENKPVTLTAQPALYRIFTGWGGDCASFGRNTVCNLIMNSSKSVIANFAVDPNFKEF